MENVKINETTYYCHKNYSHKFTKGNWYVVIHVDSHYAYVYAYPVDEKFIQPIRYGSSIPFGIESSWGISICEFYGYFCDKKTLRHNKLKKLEYKKLYENSVHKF